MCHCVLFQSLLVVWASLRNQKGVQLSRMKICRWESFLKLTQKNQSWWRLPNVAHCGSRQSSVCACTLLSKQGKTFLSLNVQKSLLTLTDWCRGHLPVHTGSFSAWPLMSQPKQETSQDRRKNNRIFYCQFYFPSFHLDIPPWTHTYSLIKWQRRKARALWSSSESEKCHLKKKPMN